MLFDELHDGPDAAQHTLAHVLVADDDMKRPLEFEDEFQRVNGIQPESFAEERRVVPDLLGRDRHLETSDDRLLDLALQGGCGIHFVL